MLKSGTREETTQSLKPLKGQLLVSPKGEKEFIMMEILIALIAGSVIFDLYLSLRMKGFTIRVRLAKR